MAYYDAMVDRSDVKLNNIVSDQSDQEVPSQIDFTPNTQPDIAVDTSARFATHDIVGGVTVRQKIGEDPMNISLNGVCDEQTAVKIDKLRNARTANLISDRIQATVHVASTSTDPLEEGGAVDLDRPDNPRYLYSFTMNLVSVEDLTSLPDQEGP